MTLETRRRHGRKLRAVFDFDSEELRTIAHMFGPRDGAYDEFLSAADELDDLNAGETL